MHTSSSSLQFVYKLPKIYRILKSIGFLLTLSPIIFRLRYMNELQFKDIKSWNLNDSTVKLRTGVYMRLNMNSFTEKVEECDYNLTY